MALKLFFTRPDIPNSRCFYWWSKDASGENELDEWLDGIARQEREKLVRLLGTMCGTTGPRLHVSKEKYVHEFGKIFAIKSYQIRLYGVTREHNFDIIHYALKKTNRLSKTDRCVIETKYREYAK